MENVYSVLDFVECKIYYIHNRLWATRVYSSLFGVEDIIKVSVTIYTYDNLVTVWWDWMNPLFVSCRSSGDLVPDITHTIALRTCMGVNCSTWFFCDLLNIIDYYFIITNAQKLLIVHSYHNYLKWLKYQRHEE